MTTNSTQDILATFGLEDLPEEERVEVLESIGEVIFQGVMLRVFEILSEEKQEELGALFEASTADPENTEKREAIYTFLQREVPLYDSFVADELRLLAEAQGAILTQEYPDSHDTQNSA